MPSISDDGLLDLCRVKVVSEDCREERSCSDCLNTAAIGVERGGCYLDSTSGQCQTLSQLSLPAQTKVETNASATTSGQWKELEQVNVFSSSHREYCKPLDSARILCAKVANNASFSPSSQEKATMSPDRQICFGADGCICSVTCESVHRVSITANRCPVAPASANAKSSTFPATQLSIIIIMSVFLVVRCGVEYFKIWRARRRALRLRAPVGAYSNTQALAQANQLRLSGWIAWHRELREREKHGDLEYIDLDSPKQRSHVEDDDVPVINWPPRSSI